MMQRRCMGGVSVSRVIAPGTECFPARIRRLTIRSVASAASMTRSSSVVEEMSSTAKRGLAAITRLFASISAICVLSSLRPEMMSSASVSLPSAVSSSPDTPSGSVICDTLNRVRSERSPPPRRTETVRVSPSALLFEEAICRRVAMGRSRPPPIMSSTRSKPKSCAPGPLTQSTADRSCFSTSCASPFAKPSRIESSAAISMKGYDPDIPVLTCSFDRPQCSLTPC